MNDNVLDNVVPFLKSEPAAEQMLTLFPPSSCRPPSVPPLTHPNQFPRSPAAISASLANQIHTHSQDVPTLLSSSTSSSLSTRNNVGINLPISSQNASSLNNSPSLRTFTSPQELATHYGIPQFLPPVPRTTPKQSPVSDFSALKSNYLSMLSNNPGDSSADPPTPMLADKSPQQVIQDLMEVLASPEFRDANSFVEDLLTSPLMSTPYDTPLHDFSTSPNDDSPFTDFLTTPIFQDVEDPLISDFGEFPLFSDAPLFGGLGLTDLPEASSSSSAASTAKLPEIDMGKMYTISPSTPALDTVDPASVYPSPAVSMQTSFPKPKASSSSRPDEAIVSVAASQSLAERRTKAIGTRKHITPNSLVPLDAPTQSRKYVLPSTTSRKDLPATFARKRSRAQAFQGEEDDELNDPQPPPNASEREQIEWKRRQNTLAARKSRKRKLEHQQFLESRVEALEKDVEVWRTRTATLQSILRSHGIPVAEFSEEAS